MLKLIRKIDVSDAADHRHRRTAGSYARALLGRRLTAVSALAAPFVMLLGAQSAAAAITSSSIDSPASPYVFMADISSNALDFTVHGTASGTGSVDLICYRSNGSGSTLASSVPVSGGTFTADITSSQAYYAINDPCVLRAVPTGDSTARPPSASNDPFQGPTMAENWVFDASFGGMLDNFDYYATTPGGRAELDSASGGAIVSTQLYAPGTLAPSETLFEGAGYFNGGNLITVDGTVSYLPSSASGPTPGWLPLQYTKSLDPSTGAVTITSHEPAVKCADQNCTGYTASGVELDRTVQTSQDGHVIALTDSWRSTDGASHALDATYVQGVHTSTNRGAFLFPGSSSFQDYPQNASISLPRGPGTIYIKEDQTTPDAGGGTHPQGAISYTSAPDSAAVFAYSDESNAGYAEWDSHYVRTVPASGVLVLRFSYAQQYALAAVKALAQAAVSAFAPALAITSPGNGTSTSNPDTTVTGTATDRAGVTSLTVDGQAVKVAADGSWSTPVVLAAGANQITAVATDADGFTATRRLTLTYTPPAQSAQPTQLSPSQTATLLLRGRPTTVNHGVRVRLSCAGATCAGSVRLIATELIRTRDGRLVGLAGRKRPGTRPKMVAVGKIAFVLGARRTAVLTVQLNAQGRRLLTQFDRLPVTLSIVSGKRLTVATARLTVSTPKKRH